MPPYVQPIAVDLTLQKYTLEATTTTDPTEEDFHHFGTPRPVTEKHVDVKFEESGNSKSGTIVGGAGSGGVGPVNPDSGSAPGSLGVKQVAVNMISDSSNSTKGKSLASNQKRLSVTSPSNSKERRLSSSPTFSNTVAQKSHFQSKSPSYTKLSQKLSRSAKLQNQKDRAVTNLLVDVEYEAMKAEQALKAQEEKNQIDSASDSTQTNGNNDQNENENGSRQGEDEDDEQNDTGNIKDIGEDGDLNKKKNKNISITEDSQKQNKTNKRSNPQSNNSTLHSKKARSDHKSKQTGHHHHHHHDKNSISISTSSRLSALTSQIINPITPKVVQSNYLSLRYKLLTLMTDSQNSINSGRGINLFDKVMAIVIILYVSFVGWEINERANQTFLNADMSPSLPNGWNLGEAQFFDLVESIFLLIFLFELLLRFWAFGWKIALDSSWVIVDSILVTIAVIDSWIIPIVTNWEHDSTVGQVLLSLRLLRLLRLVKAVRLIPELYPLWLLVQSFLSSALTACYTLVLFFMILYITAIMSLQFITHNREHLETATNTTDPNDPNFNPESDSIKTIIEVHFKNLGKSMLTLIQFITLDSVGAIYRPLITQSPLLGFIFLSFILLVSIITMALVQAVLVQSALEQANKDRELIASQKAAHMESLIPELRDLFEYIDEDGTGEITREEMLSGFNQGKTVTVDGGTVDGGVDGGQVQPQGPQSQNSELRSKFLGLIGVDDPNEVYNLLDIDGDGRLTIEEFFSRSLRIVKGDKLGVEVDRIIASIDRVEQKIDEVRLEKRDQGQGQGEDSQSRKMNFSRSNTNASLKGQKKGLLPLLNSSQSQLNGVGPNNENSTNSAFKKTLISYNSLNSQEPIPQQLPQSLKPVTVTETQQAQGESQDSFWYPDEEVDLDSLSIFATTIINANGAEGLHQAEKEEETSNEKNDDDDDDNGDESEDNDEEDQYEECSEVTNDQEGPCGSQAVSKSTKKTGGTTKSSKTQKSKTSTKKSSNNNTSDNPKKKKTIVKRSSNSGSSSSNPSITIPLKILKHMDDRIERVENSTQRIEAMLLQLTALMWKKRDFRPRSRGRSQYQDDDRDFRPRSRGRSDDPEPIKPEK